MPKKNSYQSRFAHPSDFRSVMLSGPVRIWFVDRRAEYVAALAEMAGALFTTQFVEFQTAAFDPAQHAIADADAGQPADLDGDGRLVYPSICRYPGVWVEAEEGSYARREFMCKVEWANG